ncbi:VCBS repeat-containing protein [Candidatus Cyanaurora vandensis]|uniref:FG-GAP repeat domain-containing protein n=1 Tax=Candidatus Cyanaurora vandensis TaxID=2714958 RepID=UPI00257C6A66|nr:VCBS repeat-containing protein [Candidatus Cyanaurora vandensis]
MKIHRLVPVLLAATLTLTLACSVQAQVSFAPPQLLPVGPQLVSLVTGDLDGDGDLDLASCYGPYGGTGVVAIAKNDGNGTFTLASLINANRDPQPLAIGDLDGDGDLDLVKGESLLFNNGDATFGPVRGVPSTGDPGDVTLGDLDNDGDLDLVIGNGGDYYARDLSVLFNNGQGSFGGERKPFVGGRSQGVITGDLDGDGDQDIASANGGGFYYPNNELVTLTNQGITNPPTRQTYTVDTQPYAVTAGDLDGDGDLDLVTSNGGSASSASNNVSVLFNQGNGTFAPSLEVRTGNSPVDVKLADFDGDSQLDIITANQGAYTVTVLSNQGLQPPLRQDFAVQGFRPYAVAVGDFNSDGKPDVATANRSSNDLSILLNSTP